MTKKVKKEVLAQIKKVLPDYKEPKATTTETEVISKSVIHPKTKKAYGPTQSCNDSIAMRIKKDITKGSTLEDVAVAHQLNMKRWSHLNVGMQRMNLGNAIRGLIKRGELVDYVSS